MTVIANKNLAQQPHVLIVDDDDRIRQLVARFLQESGFVTAVARDAKNAREIMARFAFDALVVDIMMPGESGLDFTAGLRKGGNNIPVLLLTALGEAQDRISGLETGADDYLPKPFEPRELVLRLNAILRRRPVKDAKADGFRIGRWSYNPSHRELTGGLEPLRLTDVEGTLLEALASRNGEPVTREELAVLCGITESGARTVDVQVTRLRRKIEEDSRQPRHLLTVRGKGYRLLMDEG
jgi:two-component system phosphate regulon response regulator OmpR